MAKKKINEKLIIYQAKSGAIEFSIDAKKETIWANLNQVANLFGVQKAAISKHCKNIFESGELVEKSTVSKMETVQIEGKRQIRRRRNPKSSPTFAGHYRVRSEGNATRQVKR
jgi:hypothetical protein